MLNISFNVNILAVEYFNLWTYLTLNVIEFSEFKRHKGISFRNYTLRVHTKMVIDLRDGNSYPLDRRARALLCPFPSVNNHFGMDPEDFIHFII